MSYSTAPRDDREIIYDDPCQPWCYYWPGRHDPDGDESVCHRQVGREVLGVTRDGDRYEIGATVVYERLPAGTPIEQQANANRHHRNVIQVTFLAHGEGLPDVMANVKPGYARSFAAALIHGADIAEGVNGR